MKFRSVLGALALLASLATAGYAVAQPAYPVNNSTFIPNGFLSPSTVTTTGVTGIFTNQGLGTFTLRLTGTASAFVANLQGTNDLPATGVTQTWSNLEVFGVGGGTAPGRTINTFGLYKANIAGYSQVRLNVSSITGGNLRAQEVGTPGPFAPIPAVTDLGAVLTFAAQGAATISTGDLTDALNKGIYCVFNQTTHTGSPGSTLSVQAKDTASNSYVTLLTATQASADTTPQAIYIYPGAAVTSGVSANASLTNTFRVQLVVAGTTPSISGTVGCNLLP